MYFMLVTFVLCLRALTAYNDWLIYLIVYWPRYFTVHPLPPAPSGPKFSYSENCCGSENAMPLKFFWDMEDHRDNLRSGNVSFSKKHIWEKNHNKLHYFFIF